MGLPASSRLSPEDYLAWENTQTGKNEYLNGEVFAMVGANRQHNAITLNIASALAALLAARDAVSVFPT